jgi:type I restriction enzyme S subunit
MSSTVPLGDLLEITSGYAFSSDSFSESKGVPLIRIRDVMRGRTDLKFDGDYDRRYLIENDDLLVSMDGEFRVSEWQGGPALLNQRVCKVEPKEGLLDRRFLRHFLPSKLKEIEDRTPFVTVKHLSAKSIKTIEFPAIELMEQRRIAAILDKADAILRKREHTLALVDDLLQSSFVDMFGDPATNPKGFAVEPVSQHLSKERNGVQSGPFGASLKKHEYKDSGVPVWGVENVRPNRFVQPARLFITEDKFDELQRYCVLPGDVLISRAGTVGRMCIAPISIDKSIISTNLVRVALNQESLISEYFVCLFTYFSHRLGALKANNKDDAFTFLNPGTLKALRIPVPPVETQLEYRAVIRKAEALSRLMSKQADGLGGLFASLSQRAFRGEL